MAGASLAGRSRRTTRVGLIILVTISFSTAATALQVFNGHDALVGSVIETCRGRFPDELEQCYQLLRCVLDETPSDYSARWSAGSSILSFTPTIVGMMSNSIDELLCVADESTVLALALSLDSITSFISRFVTFYPQSTSRFVRESHMGPKSQHLRTIVANIEYLLEMRISERPVKRWTRHLVTCLVITCAMGLGAGVWYEVYDVSKYGILTMACAVKIEIAMCVGLSQLVAVCNILFRRVLSDIRTIRIPSPLQKQDDQTLDGSSELPNEKSMQDFEVVLRSHRKTKVAIFIRASTTIASFGLYAYATILLASITFVPASYAIRTMAVLVVAAGVSRLIGTWANSSLREGSRKFIVDVAAEDADDYETAIVESACKISKD